MLSPAFIAAAPPALPSDPAAQVGPTDPAPSGKRPDDGTDFADELQSALAGNGSANTAPQPPAESGTHSPPTTGNATAATTNTTDPTAPEKTKGANIAPPVSAQSTLPTSPTVPVSPPGTAPIPQSMPASPSPLATPTGTNASLPPVGDTPVPTAPAVTNPSVATIPTKIPAAGQPTTSTTSAAKTGPTEAPPAAPRIPSATAATVATEPGKATANVSTASALATRAESGTTSAPSFVQQAAAVIDGSAGVGPSASATAAQMLVTATTATASLRPDPAPAKVAPANNNGPEAGVAVTTAPPTAPSTTGVRQIPSVSEQIGNAILARIETSPTSGRIDFHLSLNPPELGPVRVQLTLTDQTLSARVVAHDSATQQLIQNQMDTLRQRLQETTGLSLGQLDVSGGNGGNGGQQQQALLPFPDLSDDRSGPVSTVSTPAVPRTTAGTIDLVA